MFSTLLLKLGALIDSEIPLLVFSGNVFFKSLLIILLINHTIRSFGSILASRDKHLLWLGGLLCLVTMPVLSGLIEYFSEGRVVFTKFSLLTVPDPGSLSDSSIANVGQSVELSSAILVIYLSVLSLLLLKLLASAFRVEHIAKNSDYLQSGDSIELLDKLCVDLAISRKVKLGTSDFIESPYSFGLLSPRIILPAGSINWDKSTMESVLIHELSHIKRLDWLSMMICYVLVSFNWFNPLVWYALKKMNREAEDCCDTAVLSSGKSSVVFAEELLRVAWNTEGYRRKEIFVQSMAEDEEVASRIGRLLAGQTQAKKSRPWFVPIILLFSLVILAASGNANVISIRDNSYIQESKIVEKSRLLYSKQPMYPSSALEKNIRGRVLLNFKVDELGDVDLDTVRIEFAQPEGVFEAASIAALKDFKFEARKVDGEATQSLSFRYMFRYSLPKMKTPVRVVSKKGAGGINF
ncbi:MAG: hypothetical protein CMQ17_05185 [Gammaproteobacteria bacterium]|jgi:TonB family protein|nr:hypothetical protein [Gammaproteobacteria bacterium]|tara:strand:- start:8883 stop:10280 length:1398 start_codon:yes stop_codon:yes gene_type:complete